MTCWEIKFLPLDWAKLILILDNYSIQSQCVPRFQGTILVSEDSVGRFLAFIDDLDIHWDTSRHTPEENKSLIEDLLNFREKSVN